MPRPFIVYETWIDPNKTILFHGRTGRGRSFFNYTVQNSEIQTRFEDYKSLVEFLAVRNHAIAAVFVSMFTKLLIEPNIQLIENPNVLIQPRSIDILLGNIIGAIGGWIRYHQRIHFFTKKQMKKTKIVLTHYKH